MTDPKNWWQWLIITHRIEQVNIVFGVNWFEIKEKCYNFSFRIFERFFSLRTHLISHFSCMHKFEESLKFKIFSILKMNLSHSLYVFAIVGCGEIAMHASIKKSTINFPQCVFILIETDNRIYLKKLNQ